jgi:hypothetical protein
MRNHITAHHMDILEESVKVSQVFCCVQVVKGSDILKELPASCFGVKFTSLHF